MMTKFAVPLCVLMALSVDGLGFAQAGQHFAELPPDHQRRCIPGPHDPGRIRKLPGIASHSSRAWIHSKHQDIYPHCRYDSQEEADAAARHGDLS